MAETHPSPVGADVPTPASPGDEVAPGTPQSAQGLCPQCGGTGQVDDRSCPACGGSGQVTVNVGDA